MTQFNGKPVEILLIEDNEGDVLLTKEAFREAKIKNNINVAYDGEEGLQFLRKEGAFVNSVTPDIILLDLNLPKKSGKELLEDIKGDQVLRRIPVVIMTSSKSEEDVVKTYNLHANSYIVKPVSLEKFAEVVNAIENFWFTIVMLPDTENVQRVG